MKNEPLQIRLATMSEHDRYLAQAQMARAEAMVEAVQAAGRLLRRGWTAVRAAVAGRAKAYTDRRTRSWPHAQA